MFLEQNSPPSTASTIHSSNTFHQNSEFIQFIRRKFIVIMQVLQVRKSPNITRQLYQTNVLVINREE